MNTDGSSKLYKLKTEEDAKKEEETGLCVVDNKAVTKERFGSS